MPIVPNQVLECHLIAGTAVVATDAAASALYTSIEGGRAGQIHQSLEAHARAEGVVRAVQLRITFLEQQHPQLRAVGLAKDRRAPPRAAGEVVIDPHVHPLAVLAKLCGRRRRAD